MTTTSSTIDIKWGGERPINELQRLVKARVKQLGETTEDAVTATTIDVLNALRARTLVASDKRAFDGIQARDVTAQCRWRNRRLMYNGEDITNALKWKLLNGQKVTHARYYLITPVHENCKPYLAIAMTHGDAVQQEAEKAKRRILGFAALARFVIGVAMAKVSTRNDTTEKQYKTRIAASDLAVVEKSSNGYSSGNVDIMVRSDINYSIAALRGGKASIGEAMMAAANKIAGRLTQSFRRTGIGQKYQTPFPEIKTRR